MLDKRKRSVPAEKISIAMTVHDCPALARIPVVCLHCTGAWYRQTRKSSLRQHDVYTDTVPRIHHNHSVESYFPRPCMMHVCVSSEFHRCYIKKKQQKSCSNFVQNRAAFNVKNREANRTILLLLTTTFQQNLCYSYDIGLLISS
jgi:hypothetical protein